MPAGGFQGRTWATRRQERQRTPGGSGIETQPHELGHLGFILCQ